MGLRFFKLYHTGVYVVFSEIPWVTYVFRYLGSMNKTGKRVLKDNAVDDTTPLSYSISVILNFTFEMIATKKV